MTPDLAVIRRHIELLTGSATTPVRLRFFPDKKSGDGRAAKSYGSIESTNIQGEVHLYQGQGMGAFIVVNDGGDTDAEIIAIRALFVDGDDVPLPLEWHNTPDFLNMRDAEHWHAIWCVAPGFPVSEFKPAQQKLAAHYGTDPAVCNPSRVMRLAGSVHQKGEPVRYMLHELREGPRRSASEILDGLSASVETTGAATVTSGEYTGEWDLQINIKRGKKGAPRTFVSSLRLAGRLDLSE
jgi:RepB DNA-primase from phage plasmid